MQFPRAPSLFSQHAEKQFSSILIPNHIFKRYTSFPQLSSTIMIEHHTVSFYPRSLDPVFSLKCLITSPITVREGHILLA